MRILVLTQYFLPQTLANAEVIGGICEALAARGHDVRVVTPARNAASPSVQVVRVPGYFARDRASLVARLVEYACFAATGLVGGLIGPRPDVILVPSPPPTLGLTGVLLSKIRRVPVVYNVQDLYPDVAVSTGAIASGRLLSVLGGLMHWVYRESAAVVVIDPRFVEAVAEAEPRAVVRSVRNAIDLRPFAGNEASLRDELGIRPDALVVMYAGNVGRSQDLLAVAAASADLGARFVVHGDGAGLSDFQRLVRDRGFQHVSFSNFRPRSELGRVYATADLHVVPLKPGIAAASVPSKLLSIFAAGRAAVVVADPNSAARDVTVEAGGGWLVTPGDEAALADVLKLALSDRDDLARRGVAAQRWARANAGTERAAAEYEAVFAEALCRC